MDWPVYFANNLALGAPTSSVGLCLLWTPQERVLPALERAHYAVAGNLYSGEGISYLVRNILARPTIRTLALCGRDLTGSGAALVALLEHGIDSEHRIGGVAAATGTTIRLHRELPPAAIEQMRRGVQLVDARDRVRPEAIAALLAELPQQPEPFLPEPLLFPYTEPTAETLPAAEHGFVVRAPTVRAAYLHLLWHVLTFGRRSATGHSADQRELLDVLTVISAEPGDPAHFSHADWMPFSRASLGQRLPAGGFSGYLSQFLQAGQADAGVSYTYGDRLRAFASPPGPDRPDSPHSPDSPIDQLATIIADLRTSGHSRRAVAVLWNPAQDAGSASPPCLNLVQARLRAAPAEAPPGSLPCLHLTAYFRSHDIYRAWPSNAFGLRALQQLLIEGLAPETPVQPGDLVIISHSAHVYAHDWEAAQTLLAHHAHALRPKLLRDPRGSFVVRLEPPAIAVEHYTPGGTHLQTLRGPDARTLEPQLAPYLSDMGHALYLGRELHKAELALRLGRPGSYRQDRDLEL